MAKSQKQKIFFTINGMNKREVPDQYSEDFSKYKVGDEVRPFGAVTYKVTSVENNTVNLQMNYNLNKK